MVLPPSHKIPRVSWYSGYRSLHFSFNYRTVTFFGSAFCLIRLLLFLLCAVRTPRNITIPRFGLFPVRSPLLGESFVYFLFLRVLRCFSSPGSPCITMYSLCITISLHIVSSLIRISTGQGLFAAHRSFSQLVTSFFGA